MIIGTNFVDIHCGCLVQLQNYPGLVRDFTLKSRALQISWFKLSGADVEMQYLKARLIVRLLQSCLRCYR